VKLPNECSSKPKDLHEKPASGTPICQSVEVEPKQGWKTEGTGSPTLREDPVVKTIIEDHKTTAKRATQRWAREMEANVGVEVWIWRTDGSRTNDGCV